MISVNEFKEIAEKQTLKRSYEKTHIGIKNSLLLGSIIGHLLAIYFGYYFVYSLALPFIKTEAIAFGVAVVVMAAFELMKRYFIHAYSVNAVDISNTAKKKSFMRMGAIMKSEYKVQLFICIFFIVASFCLSMMGTHRSSDKTDVYKQQSLDSIKRSNDRIYATYLPKIEELKADISAYKAKIQQKDDEQTTIESNAEQTRINRSRINDLKKEKAELKTQVDESETKLAALETSLKEEQEKSAKDIQADFDSKTNSEQNDANWVIIISLLFESLIFFGVYYAEYFELRKFTEAHEFLETNPNYKKWKTAEGIIDAIYGVETKLNDIVPPGKHISELCKTNGHIVLQQDVLNYLKTFVSLGILRSVGKKHHIAKTKQEAKETMLKHLGL